jgi:hypothetical protein
MITIQEFLESNFLIIANNDQLITSKKFVNHEHNHIHLKGGKMEILQPKLNGTYINKILLKFRKQINPFLTDF